MATAKCATCFGSGRIHWYHGDGDTCPVCAGTGRIEITKMLSCTGCKGRGYWNPGGRNYPEETCKWCNGKGATKAKLVNHKDLREACIDFVDHYLNAFPDPIVKFIENNPPINQSVEGIKRYIDQIQDGAAAIIKERKLATDHPYEMMIFGE